jgi:hypothetical protein
MTARRGWRPLELAASVVVTLVLLASCSGGGDEGGTSATGSSAERPSSPAQLSIASPTVGEVVEGSTVDLRVELQNATLVPGSSTEIVPDEGHLHVLLDDTLISMTEGLEQQIPDVPPGEHLITVEFVATDHVPFDPRVVTVVSFEVAS